MLKISHRYTRQHGKTIIQKTQKAIKYVRCICHLTYFMPKSPTHAHSVSTPWDLINFSRFFTSKVSFTSTVLPASLAASTDRVCKFKNYSHIMCAYHCVQLSYIIIRTVTIIFSLNLQSSYAIWCVLGGLGQLENSDKHSIFKLGGSVLYTHLYSPLTGSNLQRLGGE